VTVASAKPCPFERSNPCDPELLKIKKKVRSDNRVRGGVRVYEGYVKCGDCGARGPVEFAQDGDFEALVIHAWNDRGD
jgi:hypothetical protein